MHMILVNSNLMVFIGGHVVIVVW